MSWTLLDYTQAILSSLDSDEVNSIGDTPESQQVISVLRTTWEELVARADMSEHYSLFELEASTESTKPVKMTRPTDVHSLEWIKYNVVADDADPDTWRLIKFLPLEQYLNMTQMLNTEDDNVETFTEVNGTSSLTFYYRNDKAPDYWTTFDDHTIIFDSYDQWMDTTLQKTKTQCYGKKRQQWVEENTFVPFLDSEMCVLLLNEAKSLAFMELKQMPHEKAERSARILWSENNKKKRSLDRNRNELDRLPNFARRR